MSVEVVGAASLLHVEEDGPVSALGEVEASTMLFLDTELESFFSSPIVSVFLETDAP